MKEQEKKKKKFQFPTAFTVLFIILILAAILTYIVPAGLYSKLSYDPDKNLFLVENHEGEVSSYPATQETLESLNIRMNINKFLDGSIKKPIAIPGTYERIEQSPQGLLSVIMSPIQGIMDTCRPLKMPLRMRSAPSLTRSRTAFDLATCSMMLSSSSEVEGEVDFLAGFAFASLAASFSASFAAASDARCASASADFLVNVSLADSRSTADPYFA